MDRGNNDIHPFQKIIGIVQTAVCLYVHLRTHQDGDPFQAIICLCHRLDLLLHLLSSDPSSDAYRWGMVG